MTQAVLINELDTTPQIYFDGSGIVNRVRILILYQQSKGVALGWTDYTINPKGGYCKSYYDPYKEQTKQNLASDLELEELLSSDPNSVPIKKVLGQDLTSVAKMIQRRKIKARYVLTDGSILEELVNMVEAGINNFGRRGLLANYLPETFSRGVGLRHGYEAQLLGIELMAQLEMPQAEQALKYLIGLYEPTVVENAQLNTYNAIHSEDITPYVFESHGNDNGDIVEYRNAQAGLRKRLYYTLPRVRFIYSNAGYDKIEIPDDQIEAELQKILSTPPHSTIINSIERLRTTVFGPQIIGPTPESQVRRTIDALERL